MKLNITQKAKVILFTIFAALFILIVLTPRFIQQGLTWVSEETVEAVFLTVELLTLIYIFRYYDEIMKKKEEEAWLLNVKLKNKEKELINAFQYLGRVNVQISMIRSLLDKMKIPSTRNQLREIYAELLRLVCSVTSGDCAAIRIVNLKNGRTLHEHWERIHESDECASEPNIGNSELVEQFKKRTENQVNGYSLFYSDTENFFIKTFIIVAQNEKSNFSKEERDFLEAIANQCEIIYLLFNSRYYNVD